MARILGCLGPRWWVPIFAAVASAVPCQVLAISVDVELVLAADASGSVDVDDWNLQRQGYAAAFRDASVIGRIEAGNGIAVAFVQWSDEATLSVDWTLIKDSASANAFADRIAGLDQRYSGGTGLTNAVDFSASIFDANGYEGTRQVIDISSDGAESVACSPTAAECIPLQKAREAFLDGATNRAINALWIDDGHFFEEDPVGTLSLSYGQMALQAADDASALDLLTYGRENLIGGEGSFQDVVRGYEDFGEAMQRKILAETTPVPLPASLVLFLSALAGLGLLGRRQGLARPAGPIPNS